jgi:hypothetical protein
MLTCQCWSVMFYEWNDHHKWKNWFRIKNHENKSWKWRLITNNLVFPLCWVILINKLMRIDLIVEFENWLKENRSFKSMKSAKSEEKCVELISWVNIIKILPRILCFFCHLNAKYSEKKFKEFELQRLKSIMRKKV